MARPDVVLFAGPSISAQEIEAELDAHCLPPAAQGDVYQASLKNPACIALIDGVFEQVPAVWHKEILWAMSQGIHVYGASSMGALRAAELAAFGMEGVGSIFEAYRDGRLVDDDEVALLHGPAESGYLPLSEPMVNIRQTLQAAASARIIRSAIIVTAANTQTATDVLPPVRACGGFLGAGALIYASGRVALALDDPELFRLVRLPDPENVCALLTSCPFDLGRSSETREPAW